MFTITLDFLARIRLQEILAPATGTLQKMEALQSIYRQVKLSDAEVEQLSVKDQADGKKEVSAPRGTLEKEISFESESTAFVMAEIQGWPTLDMQDLDWIELLRKNMKESIR